MKKTKSKNSAALRFISLISVLALMLSLLTSCAVQKKVGDYTVNTETVLEIADFKVTHDEYRCFYLASMASLENGDGTIWYEDDAPFDELKKMTEDSIRRKYAITYLAKKYNVKLTKADKKAINATVQAEMDAYGGEAAFRQYLTSGGMTGRVFRDLIQTADYYDVYLRNILFTGIDDLIKVDDETVSKDIEENFYHYTWIFIPFNENDNYTENGDKAHAAYDELQDGKDFYEVAKTYSKWTGKTEIGIYAAKGEKIELIENTALSLNEGEYSRVLALAEGHAILLRLPMDQSYINSNFDDFIYQSATRRYNVLIDKTASELTVKYTEYYDTLTMEALISNKGYITEE